MTPQYYAMTPAQRTYYRHKTDGLCVHCGKSPPWRGTTMCAVCWRAKHSSEDRADPDREKRRARRRKLWADRVAHGLCPECGKPAYDGHRRCWYHLMIRREKAQVKAVRERMRVDP